MVDERVPAEDLSVPAIGRPADLGLGQFPLDIRERRQGVDDIADRAKFYDEDLQQYEIGRTESNDLFARAVFIYCMPL